MRTVFHRIEGDALGPQARADVAHQPLEVRLGVQTAGDAGLVGHDDPAVAGALQRLERLERPGQQLEILDPVHEAALGVEYAIPVDEGGALAHVPRMRDTSALVE